MRIFDCSNSSERPPHRGGGGPIANTVVSLLKKRAPSYDAEFVEDPSKADIIFTNDVFPKDLLKLSTKKVKRMDGIFWQRGQLLYRERNLVYASAAGQANLVIYISKYSQNCANQGGVVTNRSRIILNWVDEEIFYPVPSRTEETLNLACSATDWRREEKRWKDIFFLVEEFPDVQFHFIGKPFETAYPQNVIWYGYSTSQVEIAAILNRMNGFINLSYRDPAPKVVAEAIACGLSVFYTDSGGTPEFFDTRTDGFRIEDHELDPTLGTPSLPKNYLKESFIRYLEQLKLRGAWARLNATQYYKQREHKLLTGYFEAMREILR